MTLQSLPKHFLLVVFLTSVSVSSSLTVRGQAKGDADDRGSLAEIVNKRSALLLVYRSSIVDVSDSDQAIIEFVLKADPQPARRYQTSYGVMAKKLNNYIRKYGSLSAAHILEDADFVVFFNVIEYRRILNTTYPYGELFVIVKAIRGTQTRPHIIWKTKRLQWSGDAISDFIRALKSARHEG
ncbi:MAG: hypothetical protein ABR555_09660 [Pyrinomonadaceae bacterium]